MALTFFIGRLLPLDPVLAILGDNAGKEAYDTVYRQLGLDNRSGFNSGCTSRMLCPSISALRS